MTTADVDPDNGSGDCDTLVETFEQHAMFLELPEGITSDTRHPIETMEP